MANTNRMSVVDGETQDAGFTMPSRYLRVATKSGRGYYVPMPTVPWIETVGNAHGADAARMALHFLTSAVTAVLSNINEDSEDKEREAINKTLREIAAGTYDWFPRGNNSMLSALSDKGWPKLEAAFAAKNPGKKMTDERKRNILRAYYDRLNELFGPELEAEGFTPEKKERKGGATAEADSGTEADTDDLI